MCPNICTVAITNCSGKHLGELDWGSEGDCCCRGLHARRQLWGAALQVIMTNSYHGMNIILLNRGYNTVAQTINISNSPNSAWYWGSRSNGQLWVFQVRGRPFS